MAEKSGMNKMLNWKLGQIKQLSNKLKEVVDCYVSKITGTARVWIDRSEDYNPHSFVEVTIQLDQAMFMLMEKTLEIETKLAGQSFEAGTVETTLKSATLSEINVGSNAIDQPLSSLQERIHSLDSVVGSFQAGLDRCRKQIGSVEGMKANLENLASQVEVITNDKSVQQIQQEIEYYKSKEVARMQNFEDQLVKIENTLSTTDCRLKDLSVLSKSLTDKHRTLCDSSSKLDHRLFDLEKKIEQTDDKVTMMEEKLTEMKKEKKQKKLRIAEPISDSKIGRREIQEKLRTMETNILKITESNLQSLDDRLQFIEDRKAQLKIENWGMGEAEQALAASIKETPPRSKSTGVIATVGSYYVSSANAIYSKLPSSSRWNVLGYFHAKRN